MGAPSANKCGTHLQSARIWPYQLVVDLDHIIIQTSATLSMPQKRWQHSTMENFNLLKSKDQMSMVTMLDKVGAVTVEWMHKYTIYRYSRWYTAQPSRPICLHYHTDISNCAHYMLHCAKTLCPPIVHWTIVGTVSSCTVRSPLDHHQITVRSTSITIRSPLDLPTDFMQRKKTTVT